MIDGLSEERAWSDYCLRKHYLKLVGFVGVVHAWHWESAVLCLKIAGSRSRNTPNQEVVRFLPSPILDRRRWFN